MFSLRLNNLALYRQQTWLIGMWTCCNINGKLVQVIDCFADANPCLENTHRQYGFYFIFFLLLVLQLKLRFHTAWHVDVRNFEPPHRFGESQVRLNCTRDLVRPMNVVIGERKEKRDRESCNVIWL